jgi:integrase
MFVYWVNGLRRMKKLGTYPTLLLAEARERAGELSKLYQDGVDVREHLAEQEKIEREAKAAEARKGTLKDLLDSYLAWMKANDRRSVEHVRRSLQTYVIGPFPGLVATRAKAITPDDIREIVSRMLKRGVTTHANRVRSYLHAAFQHGLRRDHDPRNYLDRFVTFGLTSNPVAAVPRQDDYERVGHRVLSAEEVKTLWEEVEGKLGVVAGSVLKLALAAGGQRAGELLRLTWDDLDLEQGLLTIPATVSKNKRVHVVPLGAMGMEVLKCLEPASGGRRWLFPGRSTDAPLQGTSLSRVVRGLCADSDFDSFTPRDLRRTAKTLMGEAGLTKDIRDRLQNHSLHDVSTKHYDRYSYLREKQDAVARWDRYLRRIVSEESVSNVVELAGA